MSTVVIVDEADSAHVVSVGEQGPPGPPGPRGSASANGPLTHFVFNPNKTVTLGYESGAEETASVSGAIDGGTF